MLADWKRILVAAPVVLISALVFKVKSVGIEIDYPVFASVDTEIVENIYPEDCSFSVTKFALATEELYQHYNGGSVG